MCSILTPGSRTCLRETAFVLSKGHAAPVLYSALARRGFFPIETLWTLRQTHSILQGHPDMKRTPRRGHYQRLSGGRAVKTAVVFATAARLKGLSYHTYVVLGDGELQEGQIWEAALYASAHKLDNLTAIIDCNGLMCDDPSTMFFLWEILKLAWNFDGMLFGWMATTLPHCISSCTCRRKPEFRESGPDAYGQGQGRLFYGTQSSLAWGASYQRTLSRCTPTSGGGPE